MKKNELVAYEGEPGSELEVVFLFGLLYEDIRNLLSSPFLVTEINDAFPDCEGINPETGELVNIEFEYKSSHYLNHQHPTNGCHYIVCWENDWPTSPIPVVSLKDLITNNDKLQQRVKYVPRKGSVWEIHQDNRQTKPEVHDAINYFIDTLLPQIQEHFLGITFEEGTKHFLVRINGKPYPLLEIRPNGKLFCKSVEKLSKQYGDSIKRAAAHLRDVKQRRSILDNHEYADAVAEALEGLIVAILENSTHGGRA